MKLGRFYRKMCNRLSNNDLIESIEMAFDQINRLNRKSYDPYRRAAEVAMGRAALFGQDRELQLAWFTCPSVDESASGANTSVASGAGGDGNVSGAGSSIDGGAGDGKDME